MADNKMMKNWDQNKLLEWVDNLPSGDFDQTKKDQIKSGINSFGAKGSDVWNADSDDLKEAFGITGLLANRLATAIADQRKTELGDNMPGNNNNNNNNNNDDMPFTLNIGGSSPTKLKNIKSSFNIAEIKRLYLDHYGRTITDKKMKGVNIKYLGTPLDDDKRTLKSYGILNGDGMQLFISYNLDGGMTQPLNDNKTNDVDDADAYRFRKIRYKKYKSIKLSSQPDCIFGHSDVKRAEMPCKCSIAADTMYNYMKSVFDKDMRALQYLTCPQLRNQCKGTDTQRQWKWPLVFMVADLSDKEITKYSLIIQNRIAGTKQCPHCSSLCERPASVKIWRVRCTNCSNSDWCFQCCKVWKGSGKYNLTLCGNKGCIADSLNVCLSNTSYTIPTWGWSNKKKVPSMRACPNCLTLIQFTDNCKYMTCVRCPSYHFCFQCLAGTTDLAQKYKVCTDATCSTAAPIQKF